MGKLFGTDGIRGIANKDLNCRIGTFKTGQSGAMCITKSILQKDREYLVR